MFERLKAWCAKLERRGKHTQDICETCHGTGAVDAPYSGSDPCCPDCSGTGFMWREE